MEFWITPKDRYTTGPPEEVAEQVKQIIEQWNDIPASLCHPHCSGAVFKWDGRKHYVPKDCGKQQIVKRLKGEVWTWRDVQGIITGVGLLVLLVMILWAVIDFAKWMF
jgi:hypothetical protein